MKSTFICLLLTVCTCTASAQIVFDQGEHKKPNGYRKSAPEKPKFGLGLQVGAPGFNSILLLPTVAMYFKNVQMAAGTEFFFHKSYADENLTLKSFGYNVSMRYIFPQNRFFAKAFVPLELEYVDQSRERIRYFDHLVAETGPGGIPNPGYSFNYRTFTASTTISVRTGLGLFIWFGDFNIQLQATIGGAFKKSNSETYNYDSGELLVVENINYGNPVVSTRLMAGFGFRF